MKHLYHAPFNVELAMTLYYELIPWPKSFGKLKRPKKGPTREEVCRAVGCTHNQFCRVNHIFRNGGFDAVASMKWMTSPKKLFTEVSQELVDHAVRPSTLRDQLGVSRHARCKDLERLFGTPISVSQLQRIYKAYDVQFKTIVTRLGGPKPRTQAAQIDRIAEMQWEIADCLENGIDIVQVDEAAFTGKKHINKTFMGPKQPYKRPAKHPPVQYVCVALAISHERGYLGHVMPEKGAVKGAAFLHFVKQLAYIYDAEERLKEPQPDGYKPNPDVPPLFALFVDNASIHRTLVLRHFCERANIRLIFNVAYRPDFMGVEKVWAAVKREYRKRLMRLWGQNALPEHFILVKGAVTDISTDDFCKRCASHALREIYHAKPVEEQNDDEQQPPPHLGERWLSRHCGSDAD